MQFQELFNKVDTFNNDHSFSDVIKSNSVPEFNKKNYRGNQHEMDQFNWQMQYIDYKKKINDAKKGFVEKEYTEMESVNDVQNVLKNEQFSKPWGRMNDFYKKIKLKEYIQLLIQQQKIEESKQKGYINYLYKKLSEKKLKLKKDIEYDNENQVIISIPCLDSKLK